MCMQKERQSRLSRRPGGHGQFITELVVFRTLFPTVDLRLIPVVPGLKQIINVKKT